MQSSNHSLYLITIKVTVNVSFYMFRALMKHRLGCNVYNSLFVVDY